MAVCELSVLDLMDGQIEVVLEDFIEFISDSNFGVALVSLNDDFSSGNSLHVKENKHLIITYIQEINKARKLG